MLFESIDSVGRVSDAVVFFETSDPSNVIVVGRCGAGMAITGGAGPVGKHLVASSKPYPAST